MTEVQQTISPVDGRVYVERRLATDAEIQKILERARAAQVKWRHVPMAGRAAILTRFVDVFVAKKAQIAEEISWQMGRPVSQSPGEVRGFEERSRHMITIAVEALADIDAGPKEGFRRFVRREPVGVVLTIAPWNYPYLTSVNSVVPAIMAGNAVILKHSAQTPLCAERFAECFREAELPEGVFQFVHCGHGQIEKMIGGPQVDFVCFTGSVAGGHAVQQAAANRFIGLGLELGGKDPAYVRPDANLAHAVENLVDGAFFNSGQSCCGIERIYAHERIYDAFVGGFVKLTREYRLGNPLDPNINLGPMVRARAADFARAQVREAVAAGARSLVDAGEFPADREGTSYMAPQVLVNVDHSMRLMIEESFAPVIGIMKVKSDEEAIKLMNDSAYGLTAAIWTSDPEAALSIGDRVETGTWFMNRCDYLDPALAWTGVKDSGRGCTLSRVGYEQLTRPKSYHLRVAV
ncbi:MAG TPA: aldehyde dehydrogenase family protein [Gammaproteobacteria bacterium]|nr:aldehyde dehydrogenase family protein [Gammaproteobacteria bacterium]